MSLNRGDKPILRLYRPKHILGIGGLIGLFLLVSGQLLEWRRFITSTKIPSDGWSLTTEFGNIDSLKVLLSHFFSFLSRWDSYWNYSLLLSELLISALKFDIKTALLFFWAFYLFLDFSDLFVKVLATTEDVISIGLGNATIGLWPPVDHHRAFHWNYGLSSFVSSVRRFLSIHGMSSVVVFLLWRGWCFVGDKGLSGLLLATCWNKAFRDSELGLWLGCKETWSRVFRW